MSCLQWIFNNRVHIQTVNRRSTDCERLSCLKFNYLWIILILDEPLLRYSINFFAFSFFIKQVFFRRLENWIKKPSEIMLGKSTIYGSMRLHLLIPTAKIAVLYLVSIKSYSKNTHEHSCYQRICDKNRFYRKFYYYDISLIVTK
jgi:hypothetical protein